VAARAAELTAHSAEALCVRGVALGGLLDHEGAVREHDAAALILRHAAEPNRDLAAENDFNAAIAAANLPAPAHARVLKYLLQAVQEKPTLLVDLQKHPELVPYQQQVLDALYPPEWLQR
jgi:hypothetical protein